MVQQIRWATLNETRHVDDQDPKEVQIERCLEKYQRTLRLHQRGKLAEAKKLYNELLQNEVMQQTLHTQAPKEQDKEGSATVSMATPLALLQFLVFKNYASILEDEYKNDSSKPRELAEKALDHYINALSIDPSARMLWYHTGTLARAVGNMRLAKLAFGNGLLLQGSWNTQGSDAIHPDSIIHATPPDELEFERFSPSQWWCLEGLCETLLEIGDFATCEYYHRAVTQQLGKWAYGEKMMNRIRDLNTSDTYEKQVTAIDAMQVDESDLESKTLSKAINLSLTRTSWSDLCRLLLDQYFDIVREIPVIPVTSAIQPDQNSSLALFVNQKVTISLDEKSDDKTAKTPNGLDHGEEDIPAGDADNNMVVDSEEHQFDQTVPEATTRGETKDDIDKDRATHGTAIKSDTAEIATEDEKQPNGNGDSNANDAQIDDNNANGKLEQHNDEDGDAMQDVAQDNSTYVTKEHATTENEESTEQDYDETVEPEKLHADTIAENAMNVDDDAQINGKVGEKRKFDQMTDGENNNEEGESEEEGPEITRSSLRASKRERDKIEHEESTRKRVQHEELELSNKIQQLFAATGLLPLLGRTERWDKPHGTEDQLRQETFSTWFETKLSELVGTATWDLEWVAKGNEAAKKKGATSTSNTRRFAVFLETLDLASKSPDADQTRNDVLSFLEDINGNQYGVFDVLYHATIETLRRAACEKPKLVPMNAELRSTIIELVEALGENLISKLSENADDMVLDESSSIALYISEIALDQATHMVLSERLAIETALSSTTKRKGGALAVAKDLRLLSEANSTSIKEMLELSQQWAHVFERLVIWKPASQALHSEPLNVTALDSWNTDMVLRYWWLRGKTCQVQEEAKEAIAWFQRCLKVCQSASSDGENIAIHINCQYDATIDQNSVSLRLKALDMLRFTIDAKERYAEDDFEGVVSRLQPLISHSDMSAFAKTIEEQNESLELLAKSYAKLGQHGKVWECRMASLVHFMEALITHGCSMYVSDKSNSKPQDSQQFVRMLSMINNSLNELIKLASGDHSSDCPQIKSDIVFLQTNLNLLHMTSHYMFRHPDFIPLVNNFVNPEAPIHAPSATTKANGFNVLMIRLWVWISHMIRQYASNEVEDPEQQSETQKQLAELLSDVHDDLGEREICGADKGKFLEQTLNTLCLNKKTISKRSLFQCYYCLYSVNVGTDSDTIEEHYAPPRKMDRKAAGELFELLVPSIVDKLDRGTQLKNDLKEVIDDVAKEFGDPPLDDPLVKLNQNIINAYLSTPIQFQSSLESFRRRCALNVIDLLNTRKHDIPAVYFNIYWIRGKMYQAQIKYRSKVNAEKTMENLEDAVEQYSNHLYLQPSSFSAWYAIGSCYMQLADEELIWSASNIITHKDRIGEYQAKAFHCFMQAIYLGSRQDHAGDIDDKDSCHPSDEHQLFHLYYDFGHLLYTMCCPPMNMEAFKGTTDKAGMTDDGSKISLKHREPTQRDGFKLSLIMFSKALKEPIPDQLAWRLFLMIGKCYGKLQRPPHEVLTWYKYSVDRCKLTLGHGHHEAILEPTYKLCAVLTKYLYRHQIQPSEVAGYLESGKDEGERHENEDMDAARARDDGPIDQTMAETAEHDDSQSTDHQHDIETGDGEHEQDENDVSNTIIQSSHSTAHLKPEEAAAYQLIFDSLAKVRKIDRRHWHHRPIFRHAWMHYYIYRDAEKAKAEMMPLFALKSNLKSHISIWKPGFERPGKHFEYAHQYTVFMIELAQVTNDANTLKILCRKLRKNQPVLLYDKEIYGAAYTAYLEVIQNYLHKHHNSHQKQASVIGILPKAPFERKCDEWLKAIVTKEPKPELLVLLTDLFDIKKLNQGHVSDLNSDELIRQCLIALLFAETSIKQDLVDIIVPVVDGNSFRIIDMEGAMEDIKKNEVDGPKVMPANIFHQATRLYRWPPAQKNRLSSNSNTTDHPGLTTGAHSEPGPMDSGNSPAATAPLQEPASGAPRPETPPMHHTNQSDTDDAPPPVRTSSLPITDLLSAD